MLKVQNNIVGGITSTDIDDQSLMLIGWEQRYTQLETGSFEARTSSLGISDCTNIFRKYTNRRMHKYFVAPGNLIRLAAVLPGSDMSLFQGQEIVEGDLFILKPNIELELICHGKFDIAVIELDSNLSFSYTENIDNNYLEVPDVLPKQITSGFSDRIYAALRQKKMDAESFSFMCAPVIRAIYYKDPVQNKYGGKDIVTQAICFIEHCLEDSVELPQISEISCRLGISDRALEYAFAHKYGISPIQYFKFMRLHGARRDIRVGKLNVTDVAMKWGFNHLGRFSGYYKNTFGELPSHTK
jgi:AraC family ethanolamine operon transcriptional activator